MPVFPADVELCSINYEAQTCHRFQVPKDLEGDWTDLGERPLNSADKYFALSADHYIKVQRYIKELRQWAIEQQAR